MPAKIGLSLAPVVAAPEVEPAPCSNSLSKVAEHRVYPSAEPSVVPMADRELAPSEPLPRRSSEVCTTDREEPKPSTPEHPFFTATYALDFIVACARGDTDAVESCLKHAPGILNLTSPNGHSALMTAVVQGHLGVARLLLAQREFDAAAARSTDGATALHLAASRGNVPMVQAILERPEACALAVQKDRWGAAAVSLAAELGHLDVVEALRPFLPVAPQALELEGAAKGRCRLFFGPELGTSDEFAHQDWNSASGGATQPFPLQCLDGAFANWEEWVQSAQSDPEPAERWLIRAHGSAGARFSMQVAGLQMVPATEVIRSLVENGVRNINVWSCRSKAGAEALQNRLKHDPLWPRVNHRLLVTFHGEETEDHPSSVSRMEVAGKLYALSNPLHPLHSRESLMAVNSLTMVALNADTGQVLAHSRDAPTLDDIAQRLPALTREWQRKTLCLHYMAKCMWAGRGDDLLAAIGQFATVVDHNRILPWNKDHTLLDSAAYFGLTSIIDALLSHPLTEMRGINQPRCSLTKAAQGGRLPAVERLLNHPKTTAAHVAEALAQAGSHPGVVAALKAWKPREAE